MSGFKNALDALLTTVQTAVSTIPAGNGIIEPADIQAAEGWISQLELTSLLRKDVPSMFISLYDTNIENDVTRWITTLYAGSVVVPTPNEAVSNSNPIFISPGNDAVFTVSFNQGQTAPGSGDNMGLSLVIGNNLYYGATYIFQASDTLSSGLTNFASVINSTAGLKNLVSGSASGDTLTLTNIGTEGCYVQFTVGGVGSLQEDVTRAKKLIQVNYWASNDAVREYVADIVDASINYYRTNLGILAPDGNYIRVNYDRTRLDDTLEERGVYRRTTYYWLEFPYIFTQPLYTVSAFNVTQNYSQEVL